MRAEILQLVPFSSTSSPCTCRYSKPFPLQARLSLRYFVHPQSWPSVPQPSDARLSKRLSRWGFRPQQIHNVHSLAIPLLRPTGQTGRSEAVSV